MACPTGIKEDEQLGAYLSNPGHENDRCLKIVIREEKLVLDQNRLAVSDYESDWDRNVLVCIEDGEPCYIIYRLDAKNDEGHHMYVYLTYIPNDTSVKNKMLYAATRATLKRIFGDRRIATDYLGTVAEELSLQGYRNHTLSLGAVAPMTEAEKELEQVSKDEAMMRSQMSAMSATLPGLNLPVTMELQQSLEKFKKGFINYLQIKLDTDREELKLWDCSNISAAEFPGKIPDDEPRYHLFNFNHTHEGEQMFSTVFIYSCPGYNVPVKQRMLYSSTKASFMAGILELGIVIAAKREISDGEEVKENDVYDMVHPAKHVSRQNFVKPKAPSKGGRRLLRSCETAELYI